MDPLASLQVEARVECARVHHQVQENGDYVGYISQEPICTPQVSRGSTQPFMKKVMLFKPRTIDEACVQAQYLENIGHKKGQPSGSK
jgi:hypothetical protein